MMLKASSKAIFLVEGQLESEQNHVIGRCGDSPIRLGDVFHRGLPLSKTGNVEDFATLRGFSSRAPCRCA